MPDVPNPIELDKYSALALGLSAIEEYNGKSSLFTGLFRRLLQDKSQQDIAAARDRDFEARIRGNLEGLEAIGLGTNCKKADGLTIIHEVEALERPTKIFLEITDISKLLTFLQQFQAADLESDSNLRKKLEEMIKMLTLSMVQTEGVAIVPYAGPLLQEFGRLGLGEAANNIENYWIQNTRGTLATFIDLSDACCFQTPDSKFFSPAKWHEDSNPESYESYWKRTEAAILAALLRPNAKSLVKTALDNLIYSAELAIQKMRADLKAILSTEYVEEWHPKKIEIATRYKETYERMRVSLEEGGDITQS